jgi:hypothetical protein
MNTYQTAPATDLPISIALPHTIYGKDQDEPLPDGEYAILLGNPDDGAYAIQGTPLDMLAAAARILTAVQQIGAHPVLGDTAITYPTINLLDDTGPDWENGDNDPEDAPTTTDHPRTS